jgi:hypothetical protein
MCKKVCHFNNTQSSQTFRINNINFNANDLKPWEIFIICHLISRKLPWTFHGRFALRTETVCERSVGMKQPFFVDWPERILGCANSQLSARNESRFQARVGWVKLLKNKLPLHMYFVVKFSNSVGPNLSLEANNRSVTQQMSRIASPCSENSLLVLSWA